MDCRGNFGNTGAGTMFSGSAGEVKIRAAHEIMALRTAQLALLVDQLVAAAQAKPPMLAGNVLVG